MINYPAVRAMCKALERSTEMQCVDFAWLHDREFDNGLYSDDFHLPKHKREAERIIGTVAARYGMTADDLECDYKDWLREMYDRERAEVYRV